MASIYDKDRYYDADGMASRLSVFLSPLLYGLDLLKAGGFYVRHRSLKGGALLDVGAGDGKFLYFMRRLGLKVWGTTASATSQQAARKLFDVDLEFATDLTGAISARRYNAITYWHVFEHLEDPSSHIERWPALLEAGGLVHLEVPNLDGLGSRFCFASWLGSDMKHHVNHMHRHEILARVKSAGFHLVRQGHFSLKFSYVFLWSSLLGFCFGTEHYNFDTVFALLKSPMQALSQRPFFTINGLAAVIYLAPLILPLMIYGVATRQGEVLALTLKKAV